MPGVVAHPCNPSYMGGLEDWSLRPAQAKKDRKTLSQKQARYL
jgi:hypothetical protein